MRLVLTLFFITGLAQASPNQWNQFRGPNGDGDAGNANLPVEFSEIVLKEKLHARLHPWVQRIPLEDQQDIDDTHRIVHISSLVRFCLPGI